MVEVVSSNLTVTTNLNKFEFCILYNKNMKKLLLISLLSFGLIGCSSIELEPVSSSADETQRILSLGLTHEENLIEAAKLKSFHTISVVTGQLNKVRDEKIQAEVELTESKKFADMVIVSDNNSNFIGPKISESIKKGILIGDIELQDYHLSGIKDQNGGFLKHQLNLSITYTSDSRRNYFSANLCDAWNSCDLDQSEIILGSEIVSGCNATSCKYKQIMTLDLHDDFLKNNMENGFTMRFNSKKATNKVTISSAYIKGYLKIAK